MPGGAGEGKRVGEVRKRKDENSENKKDLGERNTTRSNKKKKNITEERGAGFGCQQQTQLAGQ